MSNEHRLITREDDPGLEGIMNDPGFSIITWPTTPICGTTKEQAMQNQALIMDPTLAEYDKFYARRKARNNEAWKE